MDEKEYNIKKLRLEISNDNRKFEITLFWQRSLFFWGFIITAFATFGIFYQSHPVLGFIIANFGLVCSIAWTLANRGSKFWQENWEQNVEENEVGIIGPLFKDIKPPKEYNGFWFRPIRFSVSKLTIALSDYVTVLWLFIFGYMLFTIFKIEITSTTIIVSLVALFTLFWIILTIFCSYVRNCPKNKKI